MKKHAFVCNDCGKVYYVKGPSNMTLGFEGPMGAASWTEPGYDGSRNEDDNLAYFGSHVASLMCPFCRSKRVHPATGEEFMLGCKYQKEIPADAALYRMLDIFSHLEINWSTQKPCETKELSAELTEQVLNGAASGAYNTVTGITEQRNTFRHHLIVKQGCEDHVTYYLINRRMGIVFTLTVNGDDLHFAFADGIQHTPADIDRSMSRKLDNIGKKYFDDYSCYFEIA